MRGNRQTDKTDKLDRVLLAQDTLLPSSGFTASVMEAIQQQALPSAPIPFPWRLALPGIAALLVGLCRPWLVRGLRPAKPGPKPRPHARLADMDELELRNLRSAPHPGRASSARDRRRPGLRAALPQAGRGVVHAVVPKSEFGRFRRVFQGCEPLQ